MFSAFSIPFCAVPNFTLTLSKASCPTPSVPGMLPRAHTQALPTLTHLGPSWGTLRYAESASLVRARAISVSSPPAHSQASPFRMSAFLSSMSRLGSGSHWVPRSTGVVRGLSTRGNQRTTAPSKDPRPIFSSSALASLDHLTPGLAPLALAHSCRSAIQALRLWPSSASISAVAASDHASPGMSGRDEVANPPSSFSLADQRRLSAVEYPSSRYLVSLRTRFLSAGVSS